MTSMAQERRISKLERQVESMTLTIERLDGRVDVLAEKVEALKPKRGRPPNDGTTDGQ